MNTPGHTLHLMDATRSDIRYDKITFPDGQPHLKLDVSTLPAAGSACRIVARIAHPADLLLVLLAKDALDARGMGAVHLTVTYLMAARMDRPMTPGEPFALRVVADMINLAGFASIHIFDPHSEVSTALLRRSEPIENKVFIQDCLHDLVAAGTPYWLVSPDGGALKKIHKVAQYVGATQVAECMKVRDVRTGVLSGFRTLETDFKGQTCLIADDICDGGGTFTGLAALLKLKGAGTVALAVSHGIFSKGFDLAQVDRIYCTDSFRTFDNLPPHVKVFPVAPYLGG
jgi:ribose-phosphate pyrophosphokinase